MTKALWDNKCFTSNAVNGSTMEQHRYLSTVILTFSISCIKCEASFHSYRERAQKLVNIVVACMEESYSRDLDCQWLIFYYAEFCSNHLLITRVRGNDCSSENSRKKLLKREKGLEVFIKLKVSSFSSMIDSEKIFFTTLRFLNPFDGKVNTFFRKVHQADARKINFHS